MIPSLTSDPISYLLILCFTFIISFLSPSPTYVPIPPPTHQHTYLQSISEKRTSLCGYTDGNFNHQVVFFPTKPTFQEVLLGDKHCALDTLHLCYHFYKWRNTDSERTMSETTQK